jgi:membrane protease YdiL (CAAX protease family)
LAAEILRHIKRLESDDTFEGVLSQETMAQALGKTPRIIRTELKRLLHDGYLRADDQAERLWTAVFDLANPTLTTKGVRPWQRALGVLRGLGFFGRSPRRLLGWSAAAVVAAALCSTTNAPLASALGYVGSEDPRRDAFDGLDQLPAFVVVVSTAPVWEEVLFRGPLLLAAAAVAGANWSPRTKGALVTAMVVADTVLFGLAHHEFGIANVATAALSGLVYCLLALGSKSLWPAMVAHATTNLFALGLLPAITGPL